MVHCKSFQSLTIFWFKNAKKKCNEENKGLECSFLRIEVQVISNLSSRLENPQTSTKFLLINFL